LPDQNLTCGRRNVSTVPTQALTLMNNEWVLGQAARFADRVASEAGADAGARVRHAYLLALGREPRDGELRAGVEFLRTRTVADFAHVLMNLNEFIYLR
jgi:hypothetical protein